MSGKIGKIAVIGGGLGGLAAALSLYRAGLDVDVYEQAPELNEVGGGINMGPNAARILYRLGLGDALDRDAVRPLSAHVRRWDDGRTLQKRRSTRSPASFTARRI
jgi:salicylate hydroxylase